MTDSGRSDGYYSGPPRPCPRCTQPVQLNESFQIKPHRDNLTGEACPTEGITIPQARKWIAQLRADMEDRARAAMRR